MLLELKVNIGRGDAQRLGITDTHEGDLVEVSEKVGAEMLSKGWATDADSPKKLKAVPPVSLKTSS